MNKNQNSNSSSGHIPFHGKSIVSPHYQDTIDPDKINVTQPSSHPGQEPMAPGSLKTPGNVTEKTKQLDQFRSNSQGQGMTTTLGVKVANNQNTLKAGERGPSLLEDFHFLDKMSHFDRERIPERVVHARGSGAHGYFQVYESMSKYTKAALLQDPKKKTPVFVRFSTVQGFRGSPDTVRDIRGWATKFYTDEGNFDLVGNNTAVFFIQDAIKFPDFVHAVKPEPHNEVPQGQSAHNSFWDYVSLQPETLHNVMWAMSDRGIPRSYRMMEGFGIHTFRLINAEGKAHFVRFHWKPVYGKASLLWDEAQLLTGRDPDFHRKDLWMAIEAGDYPEYELGLQIIPEEDEHKFDFDILDATKLIPEELVPVKIVGKMTLNRNPDNFFAETEQAAFCPANIVPGIDFSNDPLLQGRIFSYRDTQIHRLGGANFNELPINKPVCPMHSHQRDGRYKIQIDTGNANYEPNSLNNNWPRETPEKEQDGGFDSYPQTIEPEIKTRGRSDSFADYYSQPRLFWLSQSKPEQSHIIKAFSFELSKLSLPYIRERVVNHLCSIDHDLAKGVASNLGIELSKEQLTRELPGPINGLKDSPALSIYRTNPAILKSRIVSFLISDGVSGKSVQKIAKHLQKEGIHPLFLAPRMGTIETNDHHEIIVNGTIEGTPSVLFDAVIIPDGNNIEELKQHGPAQYFIRQAYKHLKVIALTEDMLEAADLPEHCEDEGMIVSKKVSDVMDDFIKAMKKHRIWAREEKIKSIGA